MLSGVKKSVGADDRAVKILPTVVDMIFAGAPDGTVKALAMIMVEKFGL